MTRSLRSWKPLLAIAFLLIALFLSTAKPAAFELDSLTISGGEHWTINRYNEPWAHEVLLSLAPEGTEETTLVGSEGAPIDPHFGVGARFHVADLRQGRFVVSFEPLVELSAREYLLYPSGRVVPTQIETALGDEMGQPGLGVKRVASVAVKIPWYLELRLADRIGLAFGLSPTTIWRIPFGTITGDPAGLVRYFYRSARFLMPEILLLSRFEINEALSFDLMSSMMIPVYHIWDGDPLPFSDQWKIGASLGLRAALPLSQLRKSDD